MEGPAAVTQATQTTQSARAAGSATRTGLPGLLYGETENELRAAVRALLEDRAGPAAVIARTETPQTYDTGLWQALAADLGCAGLLDRRGPRRRGRDIPGGGRRRGGDRAVLVPRSLSW